MWTSTDGVHWQTTTTPPPFEGRSGALLMGDDKGLWLMGGRSTGTCGSIWFSDSGETWKEMTNPTPFMDLYGYTGALQEIEGTPAKLWVLGGIQWIADKTIRWPQYTPPPARNCGVWTSEDAVTWEDKTHSTNFDTQKTNSTVLNFAGKLWLITTDGSIWNSSNGQEWDQVCVKGSLPFEKFQGGVSKKEMWLPSMLISTTPEVRSNGTTIFHEKYDDGFQFSVDGVAWGPPVAPTIGTKPPLSDRSGFITAYFHNKYWIIGGESNNKTKREVWTSEDSKNWVCVQPQLPFSPRTRSQAAAVFKGKLWVLGGPVDHCLNTIAWCSDNGVDWKQIGKFNYFGVNEGSLIISGGRLWLFVVNGESQSQVWCTLDGTEWKRYDLSEPFNLPPDWRYPSRRNLPLKNSLVDFQGKIWLFGEDSRNVWTVTPPPLK